MKIGILGAGQLSQMLALAAHPLGLRPQVLAARTEEPACSAATPIVGKVSDPDDLQSFALGLDLLTFESEFYDAENLRLGLSQFRGRIFPNLDALGTLQDRLSQKQFLANHHLPTAPFLAVSSHADLLSAAEKFSYRFVLKMRRGGYDGKGTFYCRSAKDIGNLSSLLALNPQGFIAEAYIPFKRELALMAFRSADGSILFFPLVESFQENSRCDLVIGPTSHRGLALLKTKISKALRKLDYVGAIAFELFDEGKTLSINEVAPRVHNSGHFSQRALNWDQFQLHLLCGLGERLPKIHAHEKFFGMVNLIGHSLEQPVWRIPQHSQLHWYNKIENRPGRKLGHLNAQGSSPTLVRKILLKERRKFHL